MAPDNWKGFCELESDPAFFNVMLRDYGVEGVKVQEVYGMDEELLEMLSKPIYGLIFLFRWKDDNPDDQEPSCPEEVWFANQTSDNSCATVALLNIINNIPNVELGPNLEQFKEFTRDFPPALRGDQINNFDFVKDIHNSFARKMDMLNADLAMKKSVADSKRRIKQPENQDDCEAGFHFIAYVPIHGNVWKLDGLERQPQRIGPYDDEARWMQLVSPVIAAKMSAYEEDQIQFGLFAVVRDPLVTLRVALAQSVSSLQRVRARLDAMKPDWRDDLSGFSDDHTTVLEGLIIEPDPMYNLTQSDINTAPHSAAVLNALQKPTVPQLVALHQELATEQATLRMKIREEEASRQSDDERARARRHDYGPAIQAWLTALSQKEIFKELVQDHQAEEAE